MKAIGENAGKGYGKRKGDAHFTDTEKNFIYETIKNFTLFNGSVREITEHLSKVMKREINIVTVHKFRQDLKEHDIIDNDWLTNFTKIGMITHYRSRIEQTEYVLKELLKLFTEEVSKDQKNVYRITKIADCLNNIQKTLAEFGMAPPIIAKIKSLIPLEIIDLKDDLEQEQEKAKKLIDDYSDNKGRNSEPTTSTTGDKQKYGQSAIFPVASDLSTGTDRDTQTENRPNHSEESQRVF